MTENYNNEILNDCVEFAEKHRGRYITSGPHWSTIIRFVKLFDEAVRLQQRVDALGSYIADYCAPTISGNYSEIEHLHQHEEKCHKLIDKVLDNRNVGMQTGDSTLEFRLAELVSYYADMQQRIAELEQERQWIPIAEWEQKEDVDMLLRVVVRDLKRTFTGYFENGEFKIPLDWANSILITLNLVTHVMELPKPPMDEI